MPQYVRVVYPRSREVEIDNTISGLTNDVLIVEEGTHRFDLGQPVDYSPTFTDQVVTGTTPGKPLAIVFMPLAAAATAARLPVKADKPRTAAKRSQRPASRRKRTTR